MLKDRHSDRDGQRPREPAKEVAAHVDPFMAEVMNADLKGFELDVDERFKGGIVDRTQWYHVVMHVRAKTVGLIRGKIGPGHNFHTTAASRLPRIMAEGLEPSADYEGVEKVSVVPGRRGIEPQDLYLARGGAEGSVPVILRVDHARLDKRVMDSFEDAGPQSSGYHRGVPAQNLEYFDFFVGVWRPLGSYKGEFEPYNLAGLRFQEGAKAVFAGGGVDAVEKSAGELGMRDFQKVRVILRTAGLSDAQAAQLAYAKGLVDGEKVGHR